MDDDEADQALADEIARMKARDSREWVRLLASLPQSERDECAHREEVRLVSLLEQTCGARPADPDWP